MLLAMLPARGVYVLTLSRARHPGCISLATESIYSVPASNLLPARPVHVPLKPGYQAGCWNHALFEALHAFINSIINGIIINGYGPNLIYLLTAERAQ